MYSRDTRFTVEIPASELKKIFSWVHKSRSEETGGDLFRVWSEGQDDLENKLCNTPDPGNCVDERHFHLIRMFDIRTKLQHI